MSETAVTSTTDTTSEGTTEYTVFSRTQEGLWEEHTTLKARSAEAAIRRLLSKAPNPSGVFAAVPARSWKPVVVKAETTIALKLEAAT